MLPIVEGLKFAKYMYLITLIEVLLRIIIRIQFFNTVIIITVLVATLFLIFVDEVQIQISKNTLIGSIIGACLFLFAIIVVTLDPITIVFGVLIIIVGFFLLILAGIADIKLRSS